MDNIYNHDSHQPQVSAYHNSYKRTHDTESLPNPRAAPAANRKVQYMARPHRLQLPRQGQPNSNHYHARVSKKSYSVFLYKLLEECKIKEHSCNYIFRLSEDRTSWM